MRRSGAVVLRNAHVLTTVNSALSHADVVVKADVRNDSATTVSAVVAGTVGGTAISQAVSLTAHQTRTVTFATVGMDNPDVWWPAGMGGQPLYDLALTASAGGALSDTARRRFGIRTLTSTLNASGGRGYPMYNSPWTSLHWQLFDRYLDQGGSYYGAKKANQPLHVQYSYDDHSVVVVNRNHATASGLGAKVDLFNVDGTAKFSRPPPGRCRSPSTVPTWTGSK